MSMSARVSVSQIYHDIAIILIWIQQSHCAIAELLGTDSTGPGPGTTTCMGGVAPLFIISLWRYSTVEYHGAWVGEALRSLRNLISVFLKWPVYTVLILDFRK